jgi:hypothetical protein
MDRAPKHNTAQTEGSRLKLPNHPALDERETNQFNELTATKRKKRKGRFKRVGLFTLTVSVIVHERIFAPTWSVKIIS